VLIAWENEAFLARDRLGKERFEMVIPSMSIRAEPPVAVVERNAQKRGNLQAARAYLEYLYSPEAQELIARNYYRPALESVAKRYSGRFSELRLVTIADLGGWKAVHAKHFADGGIFDQIMRKP
jgi:sulfate transport system substrate-binding protein